MGLRTVEQYKQSLRDGRKVYVRGERVEDVTAHPIIGVAVDTVAQGFARRERRSQTIIHRLTRTGGCL